ncbi:MAG TPA: GyrI-like domain-containing protein [Spirochaetia bacterium]
METIDLKKDLKALYKAGSSPALIDVPALGCLMVDGTGDPNGQTFQEAVGSLYSVAYTLKFSFKKEREIDYPVMALEGLWDAEDMSDFANAKRDAWRWTVFIALPDVVTKKDVSAAVATVRKKAKFPRFPDVRFERFREGRCAQVMHVGPFATEGPTVAGLHRFIEEQGLRPGGRHHEIYLSDPRRAAPAKMKTIIRQPVTR